MHVQSCCFAYETCFFFLHVLVVVALLNLKVPNILSPVPLTVPEIFAKVNSTQIPSRF